MAREAVGERLAPYRRPALAVLSGSALALAFPNFSLWPLSFVGVAIFLAAIDGAGPIAAPLLGWLAGAVFFGLLVSWVGVFGLPVLLLLVMVMGLYMALFGAGASFALTRLRWGWRFAAIPALWVAIEYARSFGAYSFPWGDLGESVNSLPLMQPASFIGGFGLSFLVVIVGLLVFETWKARFLGRVIRVTAIAGIFVLWYAIGMLLLGSGGPRAEADIALLQGNVAQELKVSGGKGEALASKKLYLEMTKEAVKAKPSLIVWPETAVPNELLYDPAYVEEVKKAIAPTGGKLLAGAFDRDDEGAHNAAFLFGEGSLKTYRKIHLVPWGEFTPLRAISVRFNPLAGLGEDQVPGKELLPITTPEAGFATLICFESAYSRLVSAMIRAGGKVGIVITNDGWFSGSSALAQHFSLARFRAVENGIYVVQAANTGISGIIDPKGRVLAKTEPDQQAILKGKIGFSKGLTPYTRLADLFPFGYFAAVGAALAFGRRKDIDSETEFDPHKRRGSRRA